MRMVKSCPQVARNWFRYAKYWEVQARLWGEHFTRRSKIKGVWENAQITAVGIFGSCRRARKYRTKLWTIVNFYFHLEVPDFSWQVWIPRMATTRLIPLCVWVWVQPALYLANYVLVLEPSPCPWPLPPSSQRTTLHSTFLFEWRSHYQSWLAH